MIDVLNFKTGQIESLPEEQVTEAVASGQYGLRKDFKVPVVSPDGKTGTIDASEASKAFKTGFRFETSGERDERLKEAEFGDRPFTAAAAGLARGTSFGLSDQFLTKTGIVEPETLREIEERNPGASLVGETAGIVGPALLSGGSSLLARGAATAGKGVLGASELGLVAERATAKALAKSLVSQGRGRLAKKIIEKTAPKIAGGIVEGSFYGGGHLVSEEALGRADLNAESVIANVGLGALLGGGAGGALGAAEATIPPVIGSAINTTKRVKDKILGGGAESIFAKASSAVSGAEKETIEEFLQKPFTKEGMEFRQRALDSRGSREALEKEMTDILKQQSNEVESAIKTANKTVRPKEVENLLKDRDPELALVKAQKLVDESRTLINRMRSEPEIYDLNPVRKLEQKTEAYAKQVALGKEQTASNLFKLIDDQKRLIDDISRWGKNINDLPSKEQDAIAEIRNLRGSFKTALEDDLVWGEAASRQSQFNDAFNRYRTARNEFQKKFMVKRPNRRGGTTFDVDPVKVGTWVRSVDKTRGELRDEILNEYIESSHNLLSQIEESYKAAPEIKPDLQGVKSLVGKAAEAESRIAEQIGVSNRLASLERSGQGFGIEGATVLGGAGVALGTGIVGPGTAGAAAATYSLLRNPARAVQVLSQIEKYSLKVNQKINKVISKFFKTSEKEFKPSIARPASVNAVLNTSFADKRKRKESETDKQTAFTKRRDEIAGFISDPDKLIETIAQRTGGISDIAPNTAGVLSQKITTAMEFLYDKLPQNPAAGRTSNFKIKAWKPSSTQIAKFERYLKAATEPLSVLDDLETGNLNREGVEALKVVYPEIYSEIIKNVTEQVSELRTNLPYKKRLQLSNLLDTPIELAQQPEYLKSLQSKYLPEEEAQNEGAVSTTVSGVKNINFAQDRMTDIQRISNRG